MKENVVDKEYKDNLMQCCFYRWDGWVDKQDMARKVVNAELGARTFSSELNSLTREEECELTEELVLELLSKR